MPCFAIVKHVEVIEHQRWRFDDRPELATIDRLTLQDVPKTLLYRVVITITDMSYAALDIATSLWNVTLYTQAGVFAFEIDLPFLQINLFDRATTLPRRQQVLNVNMYVPSFTPGFVAACPGFLVLLGDKCDCWSVLRVIVAIIVICPLAVSP